MSARLQRLAPTLLLPVCLWSGCRFDASGLRPADDGSPSDRTLLVDTLRPADRAQLSDRPPGLDGPTCAWAARRKLTFDTTTLTEDLIDVPVLVVLDAQRIDYGKVRPDASDLRFFDADGVTPIAHEIERWDPAGRSFVWVKVPRIDRASSSDRIWLYHGHAASPGPAPDPAEVWSLGYLGVWHLDDDPGALAPQIKDSAKGQVHLTALGQIPATALAAGKLGRGLDLDGVDDQLTGALAAAPKTFTLEAWIKLDHVDTQERHIVELTGVQFFVESNGKLEAGTGSEFDINGPTVLKVGTWYHTALVQRAGGWTIYLDGKVECSGPQTTSPGPGLFVGHIYSGNYPTTGFLDGIVDEVRVSGVDRSEAWMALQQRSMTDALIDYGPEQAPGAACPP